MKLHTKTGYYNHHQLYVLSCLTGKPTEHFYHYLKGRQKMDIEDLTKAILDSGFNTELHCGPPSELQWQVLGFTAKEAQKMFTLKQALKHFDKLDFHASYMIIIDYAINNRVYCDEHVALLELIEYSIVDNGRVFVHYPTDIHNFILRKRVKGYIRITETDSVATGIVHRYGKTYMQYPTQLK